MTQADLTELEWTILDRIASKATCKPAEIAISLDADLESVYEATDSLRNRGLIERAGFDSCILSDRGQNVVRSGSAPEP